MGIALIILGAFLCVIGGIGLLIEQFKESILWGLGSLLIPIISLIFVVLHWKVSRNLFLIQVVGFGIILVGMAISGDPKPVRP
jgi:uncharacterized membrane protein